MLFKIFLGDFAVPPCPSNAPDIYSQFFLASRRTLGMAKGVVQGAAKFCSLTPSSFSGSLCCGGSLDGIFAEILAFFEPFSCADILVPPAVKVIHEGLFLTGSLAGFK